jgi:hypothetical protein
MTALNRRHVMGLVAGLMALPLLRPLRAPAATIGGTVVAVINKASSKRPDGSELPLEAGATVEPGTEIETERKSAVQIAMADGSVVTAGATTQIAVGTDAGVVEMRSGNLRFRTGVAAEPPRLTTPALTVDLNGAEMLVSVRSPTNTICGVISGSIVCTSKKTGASVSVAAGESVAWAGGFGTGVTQGIFTTGDPAVDQGMPAARDTWEPTPTPVPKPQ